LHSRGTPRVPDIEREASRPCIRNHRPADFLRVHQVLIPCEKPGLSRPGLFAFGENLFLLTLCGGALK
jgi:hypothetical protein